MRSVNYHHRGGSGGGDEEGGGVREHKGSSSNGGEHRRNSGNGGIRSSNRLRGRVSGGSNRSKSKERFRNSSSNRREKRGWGSILYMISGCLLIVCAIEIMFVSTRRAGNEASEVPGYFTKPWKKWTLSSFNIHGPPVPPTRPVEGKSEWKVVDDKASKEKYYWNTRTGETTWTKPKELGGSGGGRPEKAIADVKPRSAVESRPSSITSVVDSTSNVHDVKRDINAASAAAVSGSVAKNSNCNIEDNADFLGGDVPLPTGEIYDISNANECCTACEKMQGCWGFVYKSSSRTCYLKGFSATKTSSFGLIAGTVVGRSAESTAKATSSASSASSSSLPSYLHVSGDDDDFEVPEALRAIYPDPEAAAAGTFSTSDLGPEILAMSDELGRKRAEAVKRSFKFMWDNYRNRAMGKDELKPRSGSGDNNWGSMGVTLVDTLDTLWLMGLREDFEAAKRWVATSLDFSRVHKMMSFFETNIRMMGGLLSAYDLSGDRVFLDKAEDLGRRMKPGFGTSTGIPQAQIALGSGNIKASWTGNKAVLAEFGTLQVEWRYLSHVTGNPEYRRLAEHIYDAMGPATLDGMWPTLMDRNNGHTSGSVYSFGALADSYYEYLLKVWLQGRKREPRYREMYDRAIEGMSKHLLGQSGHLKFVGERHGRSFQKKMEHLTCFVGGMLALGSVNDPQGVDSARAQRDMRNAKSIAYTCYRMYRDTPTGLSPEFVTFDNNGHILVGSVKYYILRPEAAETMFVLHQLTGHPVFRQWGWDMFTAIRRKCKTTYGFGNYPDVSKDGRVPDDRAESFFLAETMKYLYLLQMPIGEGAGGISLGKYVFNTEAHPLKVFPDSWVP
eukprot:g143.t1